MEGQMEINGHKISLTVIRFLAQVLVTIVIASGVYFKLDNRVSNNSDTSRINSERITQIDAAGTRRSHEIDYGQQQQIDMLIKRMENQDKILADLMPKVDRIDTNLTWVMSRMREVKQ